MASIPKSAFDGCSQTRGRNNNLKFDGFAVWRACHTERGRLTRATEIFMSQPKCTAEQIIDSVSYGLPAMPKLTPLNWQPAESIRAQQVKEEILAEVAALKARADYYRKMSEQAELQWRNLEKMANV